MKAILLLTLVAHGVDEPPRGVLPLYADGQIVAAVANYGLLTGEGDRWAWTPEEPLGVTSLVAGALLGDGVLVGTPQGAFMTDDGGCAWSRAPEPVGVRAIRGIVEFRGRVYVATEGGRDEQGLYVSSEAGFMPTSIVGERYQARALAAGGGRLWVAWFDPVTGHHVAWSDDGEGFESVAVSSGIVRLFADADGAVAIHQDGSMVSVFDHTGNADVRSYAAIGLVDVARDDGRLYAIGGEGRVFALAAGAQPLDVSASGFVRCDGLCLALDVTQGDAHFVRFDGGKIGAPLLPYEAVVPRACDDAAAARTIDRYWPILQNLGVGVVPPTPPPATAQEGGCTCIGGRPHGWSRWSLLALLGLVGVRLQRIQKRTRVDRKVGPCPRA